MMPPPLATHHPALKFQRVAVTGSRGQLGRQLCQILGRQAVPLEAATMDLTDPDQVRSTLQRIQPELLINCAAFTAVDAAETEVQRCLAVNCDSVETLVEITRSLDCPLIQLSTDYVFGAADKPGRPYQEHDPLCPQGVYARSKARAERLAAEHPEHLIIRTCGIYGPEASGNFVNVMLRLGKERDRVRVVDDQVCCPTYVVELAAAIIHLAAAEHRGLLHVVSDDALSWCELAREIFRLARLDCKVDPITTEQYGAAAPRPCYSALDIAKYKATHGPRMSTSREAVANYLATAAERPA